MSRQATSRQAMTNPPGGPGRGAAAVSWLLGRAWSLPPQRNQVAVERDLKVPTGPNVSEAANRRVEVIVR